ncbi:hypothetical protein CCH79_00013815, partial [Gambusia affinis]
METPQDNLLLFGPRSQTITPPPPCFTAALLRLVSSILVSRGNYPRSLCSADLSLAAMLFLDRTFPSSCAGVIRRPSLFSATMPTTTVGRKLDLSKLTDEEARHVWEVVQRDFDLRKKEEDRLGELKSKIEKDDAKRELLGSRSSLAESYCIRCLQPFRFLLNVKRQCLDCQLHVCRSCSRFSRREQGWLCESCHLARVLKIGTLEWYHQNVRARFKRFGSAKVMRSLFKRLSGEHSRSHGDPTEHPEFDTCSEPEHHSVYEDLSLDVSDSPVLQKAKRRLTVDPVDFVLGFDYSADSRPRDDQVSGVLDAGDPTLAGADMEDDFHQNLQQDNRSLDLEMHSQHDEMVFAETRTVPSRSVSRLSYSSCGSGSIILRGGSSFLPSLDDSEAEDDLCPRVPAYLSHPDPGCHTSQESLSSAGAAPQIGDLNKRMSAIETLLSCLEQKVTPANRKDIRTAQSPSPPRLPQWDEEELEEQQLRLKLQQLTHNISDQSLSSEEDEAGGTRTRTRTGLEEDLKAGRLTLSPDTKQRPPLEPPRTASRGSASLLLELEDRVAQAAAEVQSAQSQVRTGQNGSEWVSYIEDRIAALSTAGGPVDRRRMSAIPVRTRRLSHNLPSSKRRDSPIRCRQRVDEEEAEHHVTFIASPGDGGGRDQLFQPNQNLQQVGVTLPFTASTKTPLTRWRLLLDGESPSRTTPTGEHQNQNQNQTLDQNQKLDLDQNQNLNQNQNLRRAVESVGGEDEELRGSDEGHTGAAADRLQKGFSSLTAAAPPDPEEPEGSAQGSVLILLHMLGTCEVQMIRNHLLLRRVNTRGQHSSCLETQWRTGP